VWTAARFEERQRSGLRRPARSTRIVLDLLNPGTTLRAAPARHPDATIKGAAGRALAAHGLHVALKLIDPARGTARVTDDGDLSWQCHTHPAGIIPAEIAATINRALTRAQHTPATHNQPPCNTSQPTADH